MGNLADELDQLDDDDDDEIDEDMTEAAIEDGEKQILPIDGARDSGVDVSYSSKRTSPHVRNFSKPFGTPSKLPNGQGEEQEDRLSLELEEAMNSIARMASYASTSEDPLIPRTIALLQDLGNQSVLEAGVQKVTTAANSMSSNLTAQSRTLQGLMTTLYSPFAFLLAPIDPLWVEETVLLVEVLLKDLPIPDPAPLQGLQKLDRETANVIQTLSQLTDTLQMGRHTTSTASRHLRTTQTIVAELRRERERADMARHDLNESNWNDKIRQRLCAGECQEILGGFERTCDSLRANLIEAGGVGA